MENVDYLRKLAELVQSSQSSIEELYSLVAEASRFYLAIASTLPYFFSVLFSAYPQVLIFGRAVSRINLSGFNPVLPRNFPLQQETRAEEENVQPESSTPYIPIKLNSTLGQILTSNIPEPSFPKIEIGQEKTEPIEKSPKKYPVYPVIQWQTELLSKVAPTLKSISSAHLEYERKLFMPKPLLFEKPTFKQTRGLAGEEERRLSERKRGTTSATEEKATYGSPFPGTSAFLDKAKEILQKEPTTSLLKPLPARPKIDQKPSHLPKELTSEKEASEGLSARVGLSSETLESLIESAALFNLIFEKQLPFLKIAGTLSRISAGAEIISMPIHEVTQNQSTKISTPVPMPQPQISSLLHEIAPSLTSWIYEGSEALRGTGAPLSAVPIAASEAETVVSETLAEPTAAMVVAQPPIEGKTTTLPPSASRLPTLIALAGAGSLISQRLSDELAELKKEAKIEKAVAMTRQAQNVNEWPVVDRSTQKWFVSPPGRFVISPTGTVLSGKPVITPSTVLVNGQSLWEKMRESQDVANGSLLGLEAARRSYEIPLLEYGYAAQHPKQGKTDFWSRTRKAQSIAEFAANIKPAFTTMQTELVPSTVGRQTNKNISQSMVTEGAEAKDGESSTRRARDRLSKPYLVEPSVPGGSTVSAATDRMSPAIPTIDIAEPDEAAEEDLRDLERKISRILSEQLSRYYGTSQM
jgi:hypothetical protein